MDEYSDAGERRDDDDRDTEFENPASLNITGTLGFGASSESLGSTSIIVTNGALPAGYNQLVKLSNATVNGSAPTSGTIIVGQKGSS